MLPDEKFADFFERATTFKPYEYQAALASAGSIPDILDLPTGAGKTEAAVLSLYLWKRCAPGATTGRCTVPRRLVYCLPMRVLVEQTVSRIATWIKGLGLEDRFDVVTLMGGSVDRDWRLRPEKEAIIVGTQDMLLSRALNRGYAMNAFLWPAEFGLLNNDCLWVIDEVQLMGNGLATSAQLQAFREDMKTYDPVKTVWMSATVNPEWLDTVDFERIKSGDSAVADAVKSDEGLAKKSRATKHLDALPYVAWKEKSYDKESASRILEKHIDGTVTLIIVNTVARAQSLFREIRKMRGENGRLILIHSRYRAADRAALNKSVSEIAGNEGNTDAVIVSTQVVEAGVDVSATTLVTELAPWSSMVQRLGRCNRRGRDDDRAKAFVMGGPDIVESPAPYTRDELKRADERLAPLLGTKVSPASLSDAGVDAISYDTILRRRDLLSLFDTAPDLSGSHADVSQFVRSADPETDIYILWRDWKKGEQPPQPRGHAAEMCRVPIGAAKRFIAQKEKWRYDYIEEEWRPAGEVVPGAAVLLRSEYGGYTSTEGFDASSNLPVEPIAAAGIASDADSDDSHDGDPLSKSKWVTLNDHTSNVVAEIAKICEDVKGAKVFEKVLCTAAKYHDMGKAHHVFQDTLRKASGVDAADGELWCRACNIPVNNSGIPGVDAVDGELWAKSPSQARHSRKNFRHEAVGAVAFHRLAAPPGPGDAPTGAETSGNAEFRKKLGLKTDDVDLASYLIAAHHGKVRMSMRTLPRKRGRFDVNADGRYVLGLSVERGEKIPVFTSARIERKSSRSCMGLLVDDTLPMSVDVDASMTRIGGDDRGKSWLEVSIGQLERLGPFRLAGLEALIRAADARASAEEKKCPEK